MEKHTAGPWKAEHYTGHPHIEIYADNPPQRVAYLQDHLPENEANAALIAAAPELLEACRAVDTFFVFFDSWIPPGKGSGAKEALQMIRAAIAKAAEGRE